MDYTPPKTVRELMLSEKLARFIIGPLGSGKSTGMIMELMRRALEQEPDKDGIRPTRFAIVRNTLQQLRQTCLADMRAILGPIMDHKIYESTSYFDLPLADGTQLQSEWLFMPIDNVEDVRRLLSLQLTGVWLSEFRELDYDIVAPVMGRVGRYPPKLRVRPTWRGVIGESNPFSDGSAWHEHLELDLPSRWAFWRQPGGLDPLAENRENLDEDYYERLMEGNSEEFVNVHVHALNGDDLSGQTVWRRAFSEKLHTATEPVAVNRTRPLVLATDLGRTPCCLICQVDVFGRLIVLHEITSDDRGLWQFISDLLMPVLRSQRFAGCGAFAVFDPSGAAKSQFREENAADIFKAFSIPSLPATTNDLSKRLAAVEGAMVGPLRGGQPGMLIDAINCPLLVLAIKHHYKYKRMKITGQLQDTPEKKHPWSDLADALQYAALSVQLDLTGRYLFMAQQQAAYAQPPPFTSAAWT